MATMSGFPFNAVHFTDEGQPDAAQEAELIAAVQAQHNRPTDLLVLSHGWNNDIVEAEALYRALLTNLRTLMDRNGGWVDRHCHVVGVFWRSKKFADDNLKPKADPDGGRASLTSAQLTDDLLSAKVRELAALIGGVDAQLVEEIAAAAIGVETVDGAQKCLLKGLRRMLPPSNDPGDDNSGKLDSDDSIDILGKLSEPLDVDRRDDPANEGGLARLDAVAFEADAEGVSASLADGLSGLKAGVWRLLNFATYYVMKERAGTVGLGLNSLLGQVRGLRPDVKIHLAGHSFGARVVTATAGGPVAFSPASMALLQGAFSHNGFAKEFDGKPGFFRAVIAEKRVAGPILATHTRNDRAVGIAYAIASRLSGDVRSSFGGADDRFGGIGRNGAVGMGSEAASEELLPETQPYGAWTNSPVINLQADRFIRDHGSVTGIEVAHALLTAMR